MRNLNREIAAVNGDVTLFARVCRADGRLPECSSFSKTLEVIEIVSVSPASKERGLLTFNAGHDVQTLPVSRRRSRAVERPTKLAGNESELDHCKPLECAIHHAANGAEPHSAITMANKRKVRFSRACFARSDRDFSSTFAVTPRFGRGCTRLISPRLLMMTVPRVCEGYTLTCRHTRARTHRTHARAQQTPIHIHGRNFARTYVQHIRQGVEIIKGAWRARGCPDDGHVNQDGRQPGGLPSLQQSFVIGHFILMISMHA